MVDFAAPVGGFVHQEYIGPRPTPCMIMLRRPVQDQRCRAILASGRCPNTANPSDRLLRCAACAELQLEPESTNPKHKWHPATGGVKQRPKQRFQWVPQRAAAAGASTKITGIAKRARAESVEDALESTMRRGVRHMLSKFVDLALG